MPGRLRTRYAVTIAQMGFSSLLVHFTSGREQCLALGAVGVISKPFERKERMNTVCRALGLEVKS